MPSISFFCIVEGDEVSRAFEVKVKDTLTVSGLKEKIVQEKRNKFKNADSVDLDLWQVKIPITEETENVILLDSTGMKKKLLPSNTMSKVFSDGVPEETISILVEKSNVQGIFFFFFRLFL